MTWGQFKKLIDDAGVKDDMLIDWIDVRLFGDSLSDNGNKLSIQLPAFNEMIEEQQHLVIEIN